MTCGFRPPWPAFCPRPGLSLSRSLPPRFAPRGPAAAISWPRPPGFSLAGYPPPSPPNQVPAGGRLPVPRTGCSSPALSPMVMPSRFTSWRSSSWGIICSLDTA